MNLQYFNYGNITMSIEVSQLKVSVHDDDDDLVFYVPFNII